MNKIAMVSVFVAVAACAIAAEGPRVERRKPLTANVGVETVVVTDVE